MANFKMYFLVALISLVFLSTAIVLCRTTFDVSEFNKCPPQDSKFLTLVDRSVEQCVEECARRKSCQFVGYKRLLRLCELHHEHSRETADADNHCVMIKRGDINVPKQYTCGEWQVSDVIDGVEQCTAKECRPQPSLKNGKLLGNKNEFGSKKAAVCNHGYIEDNNIKSIECLKEGIWSHNVSCVLQDCGVVPKIENGSVSPDVPGNTTFGSTATVRCLHGYETYASSISCPATGSWPDPVCSPRDCGVVPKIENGRVSPDIPGNTTFGSTATVRCLHGYETYASSISCPATGSWPDPVCSPRDCGHLPTIRTGKITLDTNGQTTYQSTASVQCYVGYVTETTTITCLGTGHWSTPECIKCPGTNERIQLGANFRLQIYTEKKNQSEAVATCKSELDGHLVVLDEEWKMSIVSNILSTCSDNQGYNDYWTDGKCSKNGTYQCHFTGGNNMPMNQTTMWSPGRPDDRASGCVRLWNNQRVYRWNDKKCDNKFPFICEY